VTYVFPTACFPKVQRPPVEPQPASYRLVIDALWSALNDLFTLNLDGVSIIQEGMQAAFPGPTAEDVANNMANYINTHFAPDFLTASNPSSGVCQITTVETGSSATLQILITTQPAGDPVFDSGVVTGSD
jgi:hypothetical protein